MDGTGSAVPGAAVTATDAETAAVRTVVTNGEGLFRIAALNPGRYALKVELIGFRPVTVQEINLSTFNN